jgi:hypothetical protein
MFTACALTAMNITEVKVWVWGPIGDGNTHTSTLCHENGDVTFSLSERWSHEHEPGFSLWICEEMHSPHQRVYYDEIDGMTVEGSDSEVCCDHLIFDYVYPEKAPGTHVMTTGNGDVALHYEVSAHEVALQELRVNRDFLDGLHEKFTNFIRAYSVSRHMWR